MQNRSYLQRNHLLHIVLVLAFCLGIGFCLTSSPTAAFAKSYTMPEVQIEANADSAGDLSVSEDRTFDFDGSFTAVWWNFNNLPSGAGIEIESVEVTAGGKTTTLSSVPFQTSWRSAGGPSKAAYSFDGAEDAVYAFYNFDDEEATVTLNYRVLNAVQIYNDTAELYWQFVGKGWAEDSDNISLILNMPVPAGEKIVKGETISAWDMVRSMQRSRSTTLLARSPATFLT